MIPLDSGSQTLFEESLDQHATSSPCPTMWTKLETLYRDTGFMGRDAILIRLSSRTASDFSNVSQFADSLKRDCTRLKEIGTKNVPDWIFTTSALTPSMTPFA